jgi:cytochrome c-type biogenesis protein CcmH/NrfF
MTDAHLTFGAHMLLWGFPLALTVIVAVTAVRDRVHSRGSS